MHVFVLFFFLHPVRQQLLANGMKSPLLWVSRWMSDLFHTLWSLALVFASVRLSRWAFKLSLICYVQILLGALRWILQ